MDGNRLALLASAAAVLGGVGVAYADLRERIAVNEAQGKSLSAELALQRERLREAREDMNGMLQVLIERGLAVPPRPAASGAGGEKGKGSSRSGN